MLELLWIILLIIISLALLVKGADYLVNGAADFASYLKVRPMLVGLTIVAFGTSLPELMISLFSGLSGSPDLSIGNIIGSNIFNIAAIVGISAVILSLSIKSRTLTYEFPFLIISTFLLLLLGNDLFIFQQTTFTLSRFDGILFLTVFSVFLYYIFWTAQQDRKNGHTLYKSSQNSRWKNGVLIVGGLAAVVAGGRLFTYAAIKFAQQLGVSEVFIGLTLAAIGTSLPELATSAVAAWKKEGDIAVGNIVGSNIFNILFVLGVVSLIKPLAVNPAILAVDGMVMAAVSLLFLLFAARYKRITRGEGVVLLLAYLLYFGWLVGNL